MGEVRERLKRNLAYYLMLKNISQKSLSEMLGISQAAVTNWIKGKNAPDIETLAQICDILEVGINELLGLPGEKSDETDLIQKYRNLDDYGKKNVNTLLDNEYERCNGPKDAPAKRTTKELLEEIEPQSHFQLIAYGGRKLNRTVSKEKAMETKRLIEEIEKKKEDKSAKLREQFEEIERKQKEESLRKQEMFRKMEEKAENSHNEE